MRGSKEKGRPRRPSRDASEANCSRHRYARTDHGCERDQSQHYREHLAHRNRLILFAFDGFNEPMSTRFHESESSIRLTFSHGSAHLRPCFG
jgi:hypothetical protein